MICEMENPALARGAPKSVQHYDGSNASDDTKSALDLQVSCLRRRFDVGIPVALTIARLAYGEAGQ